MAILDAVALVGGVLVPPGAKLVALFILLLSGPLQRLIEIGLNRRAAGRTAVRKRA